MFIEFFIPYPFSSSYRSVLGLFPPLPFLLLPQSHRRSHTPAPSASFSGDGPSQDALATLIKQASPYELPVRSKGPRENNIFVFLHLLSLGWISQGTDFTRSSTRGDNFPCSDLSPALGFLMSEDAPSYARRMPFTPDETPSRYCRRVHGARRREDEPGSGLVGEEDVRVFRPWCEEAARRYALEGPGRIQRDDSRLYPGREHRRSEKRVRQDAWEEHRFLEFDDHGVLVEERNACRSEALPRHAGSLQGRCQLDRRRRRACSCPPPWRFLDAAEAIAPAPSRRLGVGRSRRPTQRLTMRGPADFQRNALPGGVSCVSFIHQRSCCCCRSTRTLRGSAALLADPEEGVRCEHPGWKLGHLHVHEVWKPGRGEEPLRRHARARSGLVECADHRIRLPWACRRGDLQVPSDAAGRPSARFDQLYRRSSGVQPLGPCPWRAEIFWHHAERLRYPSATWALRLPDRRLRACRHDQRGGGGDPRHALRGLLCSLEGAVEWLQDLRRTWCGSLCCCPNFGARAWRSCGGCFLDGHGDLQSSWERRWGGEVRAVDGEKSGKGGGVQLGRSGGEGACFHHKRRDASCISMYLHGSYVADEWDCRASVVMGIISYLTLVRCQNYLQNVTQGIFYNSRWYFKEYIFWTI